LGPVGPGWARLGPVGPGCQERAFKAWASEYWEVRTLGETWRNLDLVDFLLLMLLPFLV